VQPIHILFTDEAGFTLLTFIIFVWANENLHAVLQSRHQHWFSLNVSSGIMGDQLIAMYVLSSRLTGVVYHNFW
jgi:hypothetical protein